MADEQHCAVTLLHAFAGEVHPFPICCQSKICMCHGSVWRTMAQDTACQPEHVRWQHHCPKTARVGSSLFEELLATWMVISTKWTAFDHYPMSYLLAWHYSLVCIPDCSSRLEGPPCQQPVIVARLMRTKELLQPSC